MPHHHQEDSTQKWVKALFPIPPSIFTVPNDMKQDPFLPLLPELYTQLRSSKWGEWLHFTNYDAFPQFQAALCEGNCTALPGRSCGRMEKHSPFTSVWPSSAFTLSFLLRPALIKWAIKCKNCFEKRSLVLSSSFFYEALFGGGKKEAVPVKYWRRTLELPSIFQRLYVSCVPHRGLFSHGRGSA